MKMIQIKKQLKKLAREFNLKYNLKWFNYIWIDKRDEIILQYIGGCLDNIYDKYGIYPDGRIKNISKFFKKDLSTLSKRYGGEVYSKNQLIYQKSLIKKIKNKEIKSEITKLLSKIENKSKSEYIALLTKTNNKKEYNFILKTILFHEWIHTLINKNNLDFGKINRKYWKYNEGLVTYLENYSNSQLHTLKSRESSCKTSFGKTYYTYALKFKNLLKNCKNFKQRKQTILNLCKKLRQKEKNEQQ